MEQEHWKTVARAPAYEVSDLGRIRRVTGAKGAQVGKVLSPWFKDDYPAIALREGGRYVKALVHILVCEAFHGPTPSPRHEVAHADGKPGNARADNLRWATHQENEADKRLHGTRDPAKPTYRKLTDEQVAAIRAEPKYKGSNNRLAERFGVTNSLICVLRNPAKGHWPHIPFPS